MDDNDSLLNDDCLTVQRPGIPSQLASLEWKDFFGSSVSLAPDLLSIYDDARTNIDAGSSTLSDNGGSAQLHHQFTSDVAKSVDDEEHCQQRCDVINNSVECHCCGGTLSRATEFYRTESSLYGDDDPGYCLQAVEEEEEEGEEGHDDGGSGGGIGEVDYVEQEDYTDFDFGLNMTERSASIDVSLSNLDCSSGVGRLGGLSAAGAVTSLTSTHCGQQRILRCSAAADVSTDDRKRPLSVSSTSSSMSSNSSLPRHQHKKMATVSMTTATSGVTTTTVAVASFTSGGGFPIDDVTTPSQVHPLATVDECVSTGSRVATPVATETPAPITSHYDDVTPAGGDEHESGEESDVTHSNSNSLEHHRPRHCEGHVVLLSRLQYIDRVVMELIETERAYVSDLNQIIQGYLHYIIKSPDLSLTDEDIQALFGNIESIYIFNRLLLSTLEQCSADPAQIANCFVRHSDGFVVYSNYCTNYPRSVETLTKCMKNVEVAGALKRQQMALQHGLPLGSYLLKPVQRILKYHIMLQNIVNNHDVLEPGHATIQQALDCMMDVARSINEMKRQHENAVRIQEIQSRLYGWDGADLTTLGDLVLEDKFRVCGAKAYRHIFLFKKAILIAKRKADGVLLVKAFIMSSNLMLIESIPKEPLAFHIIPFDSPRVQYTVQANSLERKQVWCQQIKTLILDNYDAIIPDKAKEIVMMLGKSHCEDGVRSRFEMDEPVRKQHEAPEYLERRRGRRRSTGIIPELKLRARNGLRRSEVTSPAPHLDISHTAQNDGGLHDEEEQSVRNVKNRPEINIISEPSSPQPQTLLSPDLPTAASSLPQPSGHNVRLLQCALQDQDVDNSANSEADSDSKNQTDVTCENCRKTTDDETFDDPWLLADKSNRASSKKNRIPAVHFTSDPIKSPCDAHANDCFVSIHTKQTMCNCLLKSEVSFSPLITAADNSRGSCESKYSTPTSTNKTNSSDMANCTPIQTFQKKCTDLLASSPARCRFPLMRRGSLCVDRETGSLEASVQTKDPGHGGRGETCHGAGIGPRRASLDGLVHVLKGFRVQHRVSDVAADRCGHGIDSSPCWSPVSSSTSTISDAGSEPQASTGFDISAGDPLIASKENWLRFPRFIARAYSSRRKYHGDRKGSAAPEVRRSGLSAVDVVRRGLTHLMRPGEETCPSSLIGERIAYGCPEDVAGSMFTLSKSRNRRISDKLNNLLSGTADRNVSFDAAEICQRLSEQLDPAGLDSSVPSNSDVSANDLPEGCPSESYYESKLFDALDAQSEPESESSDNGSYSDMSCTDVAMTTSTTSRAPLVTMPEHSVDEPSGTVSSRKRSTEEMGDNIREIMHSLSASGGQDQTVNGPTQRRLQRELASCAAITRLRRRSSSLDHGNDGSAPAANSRNCSL